MKYLFIDSMSRTGTSLLYQMLYGHTQIYFAPYRISFVCKEPFGFPLVSSLAGDWEFFKTLMHKTTIVDKKGEWPNITTNTLASLFPHKMDKKYFIHAESRLESAIKTIHNILEIPLPSHAAYYCLHDDHSYMMGTDAFLSYPSKVLTTIRNPLDMIASKKNMLVMYVYGQHDPQDYTLREEVLYKEFVRAIFSWWVASYEYAHSKACPLLFTHLKNPQLREVVMRQLMEYLQLSYQVCLESDRVVLGNDKYANELLANGSSLNTLAYLTQGKKHNNTQSKALSLTSSEVQILSRFCEDLSRQIDSFMDNVEKFYGQFSTFYHIIAVSGNNKCLSRWCEMYIKKEFERLFAEYSSYNYGYVNANSAFQSFKGE